MRGLEWASDGNPETRSRVLHEAGCHVRTALDAWGTRVAGPCQETQNEGKEKDSGSGEQRDTPAAPQAPPHTSLLRRASAVPAQGGESRSVGGGSVGGVGGLPSHAAGERVVLGGGGQSESSASSGWLESVTWALHPSSSWQVLLPRLYSLATYSLLSTLSPPTPRKPPATSLSGLQLTLLTGVWGLKLKLLVYACWQVVDTGRRLLLYDLVSYYCMT